MSDSLRAESVSRRAGSARWIGQLYEGQGHVVPETQGRSHVLADDCWCDPTSDDGLVIHNEPTPVEDGLWQRMCASCRMTPVDKGPPFNGPVYCAGCEELRSDSK